MSGTEHLTFERRAATAIVTMNRPEAKNALSGPMLVGMVDAWVEIDGDDAIRCAILTGAGGTFCAGMDLKSMSGPGQRRVQQRMAEDPDLHWKALLRHYSLRKPLIAAVEGWAVAGGTEILQATDIRVAGESAKFGVFEARRGLFPLGGSTVRLRRQIPFTVAMDLLLTAREVSAQEAKEIGLIGRVVPDGTALETALEIAEMIGANGPLAVEAIKASVKATEGIPEEQAPRDRAGARLADLRHRGRQGGPEGVRREAPRRSSSADDRGRCQRRLRDAASSGADVARSPGAAGSPKPKEPASPNDRLAAAVRRVIEATVSPTEWDAITDGGRRCRGGGRLPRGRSRQPHRATEDRARTRSQDFFPTSPIIGLPTRSRRRCLGGRCRRARTAA